MEYTDTHGTLGGGMVACCCVWPVLNRVGDDG